MRYFLTMLPWFRRRVEQRDALADATLVAVACRLGGRFEGRREFEHPLRAATCAYTEATAQYRGVRVSVSVDYFDTLGYRGVTTVSVGVQGRAALPIGADHPGSTGGGSHYVCVPAPGRNGARTVRSHVDEILCIVDELCERSVSSPIAGSNSRGPISAG